MNEEAFPVKCRQPDISAETASMLADVHAISEKSLMPMHMYMSSGMITAPKIADNISDGERIAVNPDAIAPVEAASISLDNRI